MDNKENVDSQIYIEAAKAEDWEEAMELAWRTFQKFEAPEYGEPGTSHFLEFISDQKLYDMFLIGEYKVAVAKCNGKVIGVVTLRSGHHVSLLFVDEHFHKKGIGKKLLSFAQEEFLPPMDMRLSVNAAPYAIEFYKKVGFMGDSELQMADGITYLPLVCFEKIRV